ncbi:transketolase [Candidatus Woesearchaeota archaeon]|nr:transketolase [Candidatus Woesearchaeota archaeon]MBW3005804.1 transketolase [Candidatus Woesearchaeota archaeon]
MKKLTDIKDLKLMANTVRQDIIRMLVKAGSGHSAGPLGMADVFTALYFNVLKQDPKKPLAPNRDRLILSNGHIVPVRYAAMARAGYFPVSELSTLRKYGSRLQGHPSRRWFPAMEAATGSLGQGVCLAVGMALAAKLDKKKHHIYCVTSDGEHDEGSTWEAINAASKYKLDNLIFILDRNHIQICGYTYNVWPLEPLKAKYKAFNWNVISINGNDFKQILNAVKKAKKSKKPIIIIANVIPGKGVSFMENKYEWHGKAPDEKQAEKALSELIEARAKIR